MLFGMAVPVKGSSGKFAVEKGLEIIEEVGDRNLEIVVKRTRNPVSNISLLLFLPLL